jgi:sodium/potassium-transporting ATPase subunit alpha
VGVESRRVHEIAPEDVFGLLQSRIDGLTDEEAAQRLAEYGPNALEAPAGWRGLKRLARHFLNFFSILLDVAAGVSFVAESIQPGEGMKVLGGALLAVSVLNSLFAFFQETRAERVMDELRKYLPRTIRVRRNGRERDEAAEALVPGDVLLVAEGDRVPADARLVESEDLLVNNAPLTGESRSLAMSSAATRGEPAESRNLVLAGCSILRGRGTAVVFATGRRTEFGRIAAYSHGVERPPSPIRRETNHMVRVLTVIAVVMGLLFFAYGAAAGRSLWVNVVFMLGIVVANVPEGLLPTFTLALSMAARRMARKQVLVKGLEAVEALGAVHVVCTDKTGTLTRNELAVSGAIDPLSGQELPVERLPALLKAALIASEVRAAPNAEPGDAAGGRRWVGDPMDVAIAEQFERRVAPAAEVLQNTRRHFPFDLQRRREAGVYVAGPEIVFAVKGAWESLRPLVGRLESARAPAGAPATPQRLERCDRFVRAVAARGRRVIAVAHRTLLQNPSPGEKEESLERALTLGGFLVFDDPVRPEAPPAVRQCRRAGVQVLLVTGDHPVTAVAVARECGILAGDASEDSAVLLGADLNALSDDQLAERLRRGVAVFARTTPEQKMKIVSALKRLGWVVAMTGDGVNDAPALKAADVGVAMGVGGTDVAREAADVVLLDDNFASIAAGIEEGRGVYANLQKFTTYVLSSNVPEIAPFLLFILFPVPLALTVVQILSIDLGTDLLPAIGLGREPPEPETMRRPPRASHERLLSFRLMAEAYLFLGILQASWSLAMFFAVLTLGGWRWGADLASDDPLYRSATGMTLASVVLMQIGNVVGRRSTEGSGLDAGLFRNPWIMAGVAFEIVFSWAVLYFPPVQAVLGTAPVPYSMYALAWLGAPFLFCADLARKRRLRRRRHSATSSTSSPSLSSSPSPRRSIE